jgi:hypothetical protein
MKYLTRNSFTRHAKPRERIRTKAQRYASMLRRNRCYSGWDCVSHSQLERELLLVGV